MSDVAAKKHTPTVRLRRLAGELRRLRGARDLSREHVSAETGINEVTLYRIETGRARPQARTLTALLNLYEVEDEQRDHLRVLSKEATAQGWLRPYHSDLPEIYTAYISFEDDARSVRKYDSLFVPGLLQTEEYAQAVIAGTLPNASKQEVEDRLRARMDRQQVLRKDKPLKLWAIVDEAALRRMVGGKAVMRQQLQHLVEQAELPNVTFQVIPFDSGAHPGMSGSFILLDFEDPMDSDLVYIDSMAGDLFLESDAEVARYTGIFDNLRAVAANPNGLAEITAKIIHDLQ